MFPSSKKNIAVTYAECIFRSVLSSMHYVIICGNFKNFNWQSLAVGHIFEMWGCIWNSVLPLWRNWILYKWRMNYETQCTLLCMEWKPNKTVLVGATIILPYKISVHAGWVPSNASEFNALKLKIDNQYVHRLLKRQQANLLAKFSHVKRVHYMGVTRAHVISTKGVFA